MASGKKGLLESLRDAGGRVWDELAPAAGHGSSEIAATLFTGSGFIMPPRSDMNQPESEAMAALRATTEEAAKSNTKEGPDHSPGMEM